MTAYIYNGPPSGATLRHRDKDIEVLLIPGGEALLPEDHPYTRRLLKRGLLTPTAPAAGKTEEAAPAAAEAETKKKGGK